MLSRQSSVEKGEHQSHWADRCGTSRAGTGEAGEREGAHQHLVLPWLLDVSHKVDSLVDVAYQHKVLHREGTQAGRMLQQGVC